jgi:hypothetical protein
MANTKRSPGPAEHGLVVALIVLPLVFIMLFVVLSCWDERLRYNAVHVAGPVGTRAAIMTHAVIVAGMLGTLARHVTDRCCQANARGLRLGCGRGEILLAFGSA